MIFRCARRLGRPVNLASTLALIFLSAHAHPTFPKDEATVVNEKKLTRRFVSLLAARCCRQPRLVLMITGSFAHICTRPTDHITMQTCAASPSTHPMPSNLISGDVWTQCTMLMLEGEYWKAALHQDRGVREAAA